MNKRIYLSSPHMSGKELSYIENVFKSNYIAPLGEYVDLFEDRVKSYTGIEHALALSSATAGLHLALRVVGIKEGDIVLASTFTFIGSISPILYQGATPVFIDSETQSWNLSARLLNKYILTCKVKPKALILTHLYGQCADIIKIADICKYHGIYLIEDAAESLGARYDGQHAGTFGDMAVYSFNGNKILSTSGGGMLVSSNASYIEKAKFYSTQAREDELHYEHKEFGYNYRMSNVLAAIGVAQMEVLEERVSQKRAIFSWYEEGLSDVDEITFMPELEDTVGNRWLTTILFERTNPLDVIKALDEVNVESRPLWKPMHLQALFKDAEGAIDGTSEGMFNKGLCLASSTTMTQADVLMICETIKRCLSER